MLTNVTCHPERAWITGDCFHRVAWIDSAGDYQSQTIHCCESAWEAVCEVLGPEYADAFDMPNDDDE